MRRLARALLGGRWPRVDPDGRDALVGRLRAERDHYSRVLAAATGDAIFTTDANGVLTLFNDGAERLLGYSAGEVVGRMRALELHLPEEIEAAARELGVEPGRAVFTTLAGRGAEAREWTFVHRDGSHVRVAHTVTALRDEHGEIVGHVGLAHDITARHRGELALRKSEERFRALSEHAPVGIVQTDEHGGCWYANRRFCEIVGRSMDDVRGEGWLAILGGDDHAGVLARWAAELGDGRGFDGEFRVTRPDGTSAHVRATAGPIQADGGRATGFVITTQDISERVGAQRRLSEQEQLFRDTLENVALVAVQLDPAGRVVYCNPHLAELLGAPPSRSPASTGSPRWCRRSARGRVSSSSSR